MGISEQAKGFSRLPFLKPKKVEPAAKPVVELPAEPTRTAEVYQMTEMMRDAHGETSHAEQLRLAQMRRSVGMIPLSPGVLLEQKATEVARSKGIIPGGDGDGPGDANRNAYDRLKADLKNRR